MINEQRHLWQYMDYYRDIGKIISIQLPKLNPYFNVNGVPHQLQGKFQSLELGEITFKVYYTGDKKITSTIGIVALDANEYAFVIYQDENLMGLYKKDWIEIAVIRELVRAALRVTPTERRLAINDSYLSFLATTYAAEPYVLSYHTEDQVILWKLQQRDSSKAFDDRMFFNAFIVALMQKNAVNVKEIEVDLEAIHLVGKDRFINDYLDYRPGIQSEYIHREFRNRILFLTRPSASKEKTSLYKLELHWVEQS